MIVDTNFRRVFNGFMRQELLCGGWLRRDSLSMVCLRRGAVRNNDGTDEGGKHVSHSRLEFPPQYAILLMQ